MRYLVLLRGACGSGKSTFIREKSLEQFTLSADDIRMMFQTPLQQLDGKSRISIQNDKQVWAFLNQLLEERMKRGEFTIVDAMHSRPEDFARYSKLCDTYRYRCFVVDFTDVPIEEAKRRNLLRPEYKHVDELVIENVYERFKGTTPPGWVTVIKPEQWDEVMQYRPFDASKYKRVHVVGDIQGSATPLQQYFEQHGWPWEHTDEYYVFVGDFCDRGCENFETLLLVSKLRDCKNVYFVEGNHERHLWDWANGVASISREFESETKPELEGKARDTGYGVENLKKLTRQIYRKLGQICFLYWNAEGGADKGVGVYLLITHAGIAKLPDNLLFLASDQFRLGVGKYEDDIDAIWSENMRGLRLYHPDTNGCGGKYQLLSGYTNVFQVHGHRNTFDNPTKAGDYSFNLEDKVEFQGHLRVLQLDAHGFNVVSIENTVVNERYVPKPEPEMTLLEQLRKNRLVVEKMFPDTNVAAFNFGHEVFHGRLWDAQNVKARGLFINTATGKIAARSYDKFFNIGERWETKLDALQRNLAFPAVVYEKYNGFLGITGFDDEKDTPDDPHEALIVASKTTLGGSFAKLFRGMLEEHFSRHHVRSLDAPEEVVSSEDAQRAYIVNSQLQLFAEFLRLGNLSLVFEVIHPDKDPHIIEYAEPRLVLLDAVVRSDRYEKKTYEELLAIGEIFGFEVKQQALVLNSWAEFRDWYDSQTRGWDLSLEGYVIEGANGFMTKFKLPAYNFWKKMRWLKEKLCERSPQIRGGFIQTPEEQKVFAFMRKLGRDKLYPMDIISIRKAMEEEAKEVLQPQEAC